MIAFEAPPTRVLCCVIVVADHVPAPSYLASPVLLALILFAVTIFISLRERQVSNAVDYLKLCIGRDTDDLNGVSNLSSGYTTW